MPRSKAHTVTGDASQALALLVAARAAGFELAHVTVGGCHVEVRLPASAPVVTDAPSTGPRDQIYAQYGGELYRRTVGGSTSHDRGGPVGEYQPAIGVDQ